MLLESERNSLDREWLRKFRVEALSNSEQMRGEGIHARPSRFEASNAVLAIGEPAQLVEHPAVA